MNLPGVALLDFERTREVAKAGYDAAIADVEAWVATRHEIGAAA